MAVVGEFKTSCYEKMMRQDGTSYAVADGWSIGWVGNGWQVFYNAIDAWTRLAIARKYDIQPVMIWASFHAAWEWLHELSDSDIHDITVVSVRGK